MLPTSLLLSSGNAGTAQPNPELAAYGGGPITAAPLTLGSKPAILGSKPNFLAKKRKF